VRIKIFALVSILVAVLCFGVNAAEVTLRWDANDPAPEGYRLFVHSGSGFDYGSPAWEGTSTQATLSDLSEDIEYHFVCRAFDGDIESGDSNEVIYTIEAAPEVLRYPKRPKTLILQFD
jgi:hypothetical protein